MQKQQIKQTKTTKKNLNIINGKSYVREDELPTLQLTIMPKKDLRCEILQMFCRCCVHMEELLVQ